MRRRRIKPWITHPGALGGPGYTSKPQLTRRKLLARSVNRDGYDTTVRRLLVIRTRGIKPSTRAIINSDIAWLRRVHTEWKRTMS